MTSEGCEYDNLMLLQSVIIVILILLVFALGYVAFLMCLKGNSSYEGYVDCMVDTYFYGYLQKTIPDHGGTEGGMKDRIAVYKAKHNLSDDEFPFHKLFLIVPSSGYVPPILEKMDSNGRIELRQPIEPVEQNRAGVYQRSYKTSVYKIKFRGEQKHISLPMEGTPPLLCLFDSANENPELKANKKDIIHLFYTKLKAKLKERPEFGDSCEVVFFDDEADEASLADDLIMRYLEQKNGIY